jgi:hypothetical protein
MSSEISITLKATDEASSVIADADRNISESMQRVEEAGRGYGVAVGMRLMLQRKA